MANTYTVSLQIPTTEVIGPLTNQKTVGMLSPDAFQTNGMIASPNYTGPTLHSVRPNDMVALLPNLILNNVYHRNGDVIVDADPYDQVYLTSEYPTVNEPAASITAGGTATGTNAGPIPLDSAGVQ